MSKTSQTIDEILRQYREACFETKRRLYEDKNPNIELVVMGQAEAKASLTKLITQYGIEQRRQELIEMARKYWQRSIPEIAVLERIKELEKKKEE